MTALSQENIENPILYSGGSAETCALWKPHWGISHDTLASYATSEKIAILCRSDMSFYFTINTTSGNWRTTIYGTAGSEGTVDTADNTACNIDLTAYSNAFPDEDNCNGYTTFILVLEALTGSISTYGGGTSAQTNASLWCMSNTAGLFTAYGMGIGAFYCEQIYDLAGTLQTTTGCFRANAGLRSTNFTSNASSAFLDCVSLIDVQTAIDKTGTNYSTYFDACTLLDNDISGTYPNATNMTSFIRANRSRRKTVELELPVCTTFTTNITLTALKDLTFIKIRLYSGSGTVFSVANASQLDTQQTVDTVGKANLWTYLLENEATVKATYPAFEADNYVNSTYYQIETDLLANYPLYVAWKTCLTSKTFVITGCPNAATVDGTPITNQGGTLTR